MGASWQKLKEDEEEENRSNSGFRSRSKLLAVEFAERGADGTEGKGGEI